MSAVYLQHFGLQRAPFSITPNPAFFYGGHSRADMLDAMLYAVTHGEGIIKVTGEVGSGKTMLCRMLASRLPSHIDAIYLVNPRLDPDGVLFAIAAELGLEAGGRRADEVLRLLNADLIRRHARGRQVVLLVEEAQAMPLDTLEAVRLLTNLETSSHKLLQIVLFGQPELDEHLALPAMRQLSERITHSFFVPPLPRELVPAFLLCRLRAAGYTGGPLFSSAAVRHIAQASGGIVRRINIIADKAMMAAYAEEAVAVTARHVRLAVAECSFAAPMGPRPAWLAGGVAVAGAAALLLWLAWPLRAHAVPGVVSLPERPAPAVAIGDDAQTQLMFGAICKMIIASTANQHPSAHNE